MSGENTSDNIDAEGNSGPDSEESEASAGDILIEARSAKRDEQREQVSYDWCEIIREAGEQYRERGEMADVVDELDICVEKVCEALTVYRLLFQEPPGKAAVIASDAGRYFFAVNNEVERRIDRSDLGDSFEELVREYVGAIYLDYNIEKEPIGDPVEQDIPNSGLLDHTTVEISPSTLESVSQIKDIAAQVRFPTESLMPPIAKFASSPTTVNINELLGPMEDVTGSMTLNCAHGTQIEGLAASVQPILDDSPLMSSTLALPRASMDGVTIPGASIGGLADVAPSIEDLAREIAGEIEFPESILADLTVMYPKVNAATASVASTGVTAQTGISDRSVAPPEPEVVERSESSLSQEAESIGQNGPIVDPVGATVDATLPAPDMLSTELIFEIPVLLVDSILSAHEVRSWFSGLEEEYQDGVIKFLLICVTFYVTGSLAAAGLVALFSHVVSQMVMTDMSERG